MVKEAAVNSLIFFRWVAPINDITLFVVILIRHQEDEHGKERVRAAYLYFRKR